MATSTDSPRQAEVDHLKALAPGLLFIYHCPGMFFEGDPDAAGHLFGGSIMSDDEREAMFLDDRKDATLEQQLVAELRRAGKVHTDLADEIEQRITDAAATEAA